MAGTSKKTTVVSVRVPNDTLAEWQALAGGKAIAAYVLERALQADAAEARAARLESELAIRSNVTAISDKRAAKKDETAVTLSLPTAFLAQMIPGDKVAMMEDEVLRRFGYGLFRKTR